MHDAHGAWIAIALARNDRRRMAVLLALGLSALPCVTATPSTRSDGAAPKLVEQAPAACRDRWLEPFSSDSIWNTAIGSAAEFRPANLFHADDPRGVPDNCAPTALLSSPRLNIANTDI